MFKMWILAKYAVLLPAVGMNCTRDGAVVERVKNHDARLLKKSAPRFSQITPRSHSAPRCQNESQTADKNITIIHK